MDRLAVYPGDLTPSGWETAKLGHGLGLLPDAIQPRIRKTINGDWSLTLRYPLQGRGAELLRPDRLILARGQLWRVLRVSREDGGGIRALSVEAPHLAYDLRDSVIENIETAENPDTLDGITAQQALSQLLAGTPFVPGIADVPTGTLDYLDILQKNRMECLKDQLLPKWGGELVFDNWVIHLRAQAGFDRRYPIRRGRNLKAIAVTEDITGNNHPAACARLSGRELRVHQRREGLYRQPARGGLRPGQGRLCRFPGRRSARRPDAQGAGIPARGRYAPGNL